MLALTLAIASLVTAVAWLIRHHVGESQRLAEEDARARDVMRRVCERLDGLEAENAVLRANSIDLPPVDDSYDYRRPIAPKVHQ